MGETTGVPNLRGHFPRRSFGEDLEALTLTAGLQDGVRWALYHKSIDLSAQYANVPRTDRAGIQRETLVTPDNSFFEDEEQD